MIFGTIYGGGFLPILKIYSNSDVIFSWNEEEVGASQDFFAVKSQ